MNKKRLLSLLSIVVALAICLSCAFASSAIVSADSGTLKRYPGNTQSRSPEFSKAWLDNIIIRDDVTAFAGARIVPKAAYPYSLTYEEFINQVNNYAVVNRLDKETITGSYEQIIDMLYYLAVAADMTEDFDVMYKYLAKQGIKMPANVTARDKIDIAVLYAVQKKHMAKVILDKDVTITDGMTLDNATVEILSAVTGSFTPSSVQNVAGFAMQSIKNYVDTFDSLPVSDTPTDDELFHWVKVLVAAGNDYKVPVVEYNYTTEAERAYVEYAYNCAIFDKVYDIHIDPVRMAEADFSSDELAIPVLILTTMLDSAGVSYNKDAAPENLFDLACRAGFFELEEEFYSDVYEYDVYVTEDCEKLWFTPFALADQIEGSNEYVSILLNGKSMKPSGTEYAALDVNKPSEKVNMIVSYQEPGSSTVLATYTFNVIKEKQTGPADDTLVGKIERAIDSVVPDDNEKANAIVGGVVSSVERIAATAVDTVTTADDSYIISTYPSEIEKETVTSAADALDSISSELAEFSYLQEILGETYAASTTGTYDLDSLTTTAASTGGSGVINTIKENPEIVIAPTGVAALGGLAGFLFNSKKKKSHTVEDDDVGTEDIED